MSYLEPVKCMTSSCNRWAATRGVCTRCYSKMYYYVKVKLSTWDKLQSDGKILPPKVREKL